MRSKVNHFAYICVTLSLLIPFDSYCAEEKKIDQSAAVSPDKLSDEEITAKIRDMYAKTPDLNFYDIQVETVDGVVYLSATVRYYKQVYRAIEIAKEVPGVKDVDATKLYYFRVP